MTTHDVDSNDPGRYLTEADLLAKRADTPHGMPEDDVHVPSLGGWVRVRGLSRDEVMAMRTAADNDPDSLDGRRQLVIERKMLAAGMLKPSITEAAAGGWQLSSTAGEIDPVSDKISELSGMARGSHKSGVDAAGDRSRTRVRTLPGEQAGDDGGPAPQ